MVLLIDNYDSFSYNLYQLVGNITNDIKVVRNDEMTVEELVNLKPTHIVLSPGPGRPEDAGICVELIKQLSGKIPILGVCLGHQAICLALGGEISYAKKQMHGKQSQIILQENSRLFAGMFYKLEVGRYHSLVAVRERIPNTLTVIAEDEEGEVMAVESEEKKLYGVQFHPESILTPKGMKIITNFLKEGMCHD